MTLDEAKRLLGEIIQEGCLRQSSPYILWKPANWPYICLAGDFTVDELEAILVYVRAAQKPLSPPPLSPLENVDYITIEPIHDNQALVVIMHYHKDDYIQTKVSRPLSLRGAQALAESWAAALKLEIR